MDHTILLFTRHIPHLSRAFAVSYCLPCRAWAESCVGVWDKRGPLAERDTKALRPSAPWQRGCALGCSKDGFRARFEG